MRLWLLALAAATLGACAAAPAARLDGVVCVPAKAYTPAEEKALAAAIAALPANSPLGGAMVDYGHMRAAARACEGAGH